MVVLDMVEVVAVPCVAHQRVCDVWEEVIEPCEVLPQDAAHVYVLVHHQGIGTHIEPLPHSMQQPVPPVEIIEQVYRRGYRGREVQQQMRGHNDIGFDTDNGARPPDIRVDNPLPQPGRLDIREVVGEENGGFEMGRLWVVGGLDRVNRLLFMLLDICSALEPSLSRRVS